jgi:hypothetical protein
MSGQNPIVYLDNSYNDLCNGDGICSSLTGAAKTAFDYLSVQMNKILNLSQEPCPGDGNKDNIVDQKDLDEYQMIASAWGKSSTYDFNHDGKTDELDRKYITDNWQKKCFSNSFY